MSLEQANLKVALPSSVGPFPIPLRTLMGPGPSDVHPRVLLAMAKPTLGHLDPEFILMMEEIKKLLCYAFQTNNKATFAVSGPGTAGMEMAIVNLVEPGEKVLVGVNGIFGKRMVENVERCGGVAVIYEEPMGQPLNPEKVEGLLKSQSDVRYVAFVHAETSTGVENPAQALCSGAHQYKKMIIMDTVTGLGGVPVLIDEWGVDVAYSGTQKCLGAPPGLSPITFSERAVAHIKARKTKVQSWFLDLNLLMGYWDGAQARTYHQTAPINACYGLHESLVLLAEEGLQKSWARHKTNAKTLEGELTKLGLKYLVQEPYRLPQLHSIHIPSGVEDAKVRKSLLTDWNLEIGGGLGSLAGKIWRLGLMGHGSNAKNIAYCTHALQSCLLK